MYFAAVELKNDDPRAAIFHFVRTAADLGIQFRYLQVFGRIEYAGFPFIRFRTDCPTYPPIIARFKVQGRGIIAPGYRGYTAFLANGRQGNALMTLMQAVPLLGQEMEFFGPAHPHWQAQFHPSGSFYRPAE